LFVATASRAADTGPDDARETSTSSPTRVTASERVGYLSALLPAPEGRYLDYSRGMDEPIERERLIDVGCNIGAIDAAIDPDRVFEPEPTVEAINAALLEASRLGGVVKPRAIDTLRIESDLIRMQDRTIFDGSRIGDFSLSGEDRRSALECRERQLVGVTHVRTGGNGGFHYGLRVEDSENVCLQFATIFDRDQNGVRLSTRSRDVTVRYCDIDTGRDERGNGNRRNQHGIVAASFSGPEEHAPSGRFDIVYSTGQAYYSNRIVNGDGHSIDCHAGNVEICGNWTDNCRYGAKFPHSANALIHHNRFGGARPGTPTRPTFVLRLYSANDYAPGVGYECDQLFLFANRFEDNAGQQIRLDGVHGTVYLLANEYDAEGDTVLRVSRASDTSTDPRSYHGRLHLHGQDVRLSDAVRGEMAERVIAETDPRLQALDVERMVELMNAPKNSNWRANVRHPLPVVTRRDHGVAGAPEPTPTILDLQVLPSPSSR